MDTDMHKTMTSIVSLEKNEIIRSQEFVLSEAMLKFEKKKIILGPKTAILGPQFCRILVLLSHFWWSGGSGPWDLPLNAHHPPSLLYISTAFKIAFPKVLKKLNTQTKLR